MKKIILKETFNLVGKDILALDRGRWRYWFLVGNRFDSGQDRLMNNLIVYEVLI